MLPLARKHLNSYQIGIIKKLIFLSIVLLLYLNIRASIPPSCTNHKSCTKLKDCAIIDLPCTTVFTPGPNNTVITNSTETVSNGTFFLVCKHDSASTTFCLDAGDHLCGTEFTYASPDATCSTIPIQNDVFKNTCQF